MPFLPMPPLAVTIVWLAIAGIAILIGTAITVRRYFDYQDQPIVNGGRQWKDVLSCAYCDELTENYIHLILDGETYIPVCFDCQCHMGIVNPDGTTSQAFYYQVAECDRL